MATINVTTDLEVMDRYIALIKESLNTDSVYARTKETLQEFFDKGSMSDTDRANIISQVMTNLNNSLVNAAMGTALDWSKSEKDIGLKKAELGKQLDILDAEIALKAKDLSLKDKDLELKTKELDLLVKQVAKLGYDSIATQAQTIRTYGTPTVVNGAVTKLEDEGKLYEEIQLVQQQILTQKAEEALLDTKKDEMEASVHKIVADTYWNYGALNYTISDTGLVVNSVTDNQLPNSTPLAEHQGNIAIEQAKGYAYNAWANAMSGSATFLATALSANDTILNDAAAAGDIASAISTFTTTAGKLNSVLHPYNSGL